MDLLLSLKTGSVAVFRFVSGCLSRVALTKGSIRTQILIFSLAMSAIAVALGGYSVLGIRHAGDLVARTFDKSLMSINYARAAGADFAAMRVASSQRLLTTDPTARARLDSQIEALAKTLSGRSDRRCRSVAVVPGRESRRQGSGSRRRLDGAAPSRRRIVFAGSCCVRVACTGHVGR
ncbi:MCP four helix bundle domain-containing protein [Bradyrhizobium sp. ISRA435]|nr:MCP four helix bundle domain-containing protein [Bradyrhizobium sp. ISRA435]